MVEGPRLAAAWVTLVDPTKEALREEPSGPGPLVAEALGIPAAIGERCYLRHGAFSKWSPDQVPAYCSSVTGSSQSVVPSVLNAGLMAMWTMKVSGPAPCQCFSSGAK